MSSRLERYGGWIALICLLLGGSAGWLALEKEARDLERKAARKDRPHLAEEARSLRELQPRVALALAPLVGGVFFVLLGAGASFRRLGAARVAALVAGLVAFTWLLAATPPPLGGGVDLARAPPGLRWLPVADLYVLAIVVALSAAIVRSGRSLVRPGLTGTALLVFFVLWIPFDLRWLKGLWEGPGRLSYAVPALWIVFLALVSEGVVAGRRRALGLRAPTLRDLGPFLALVGLLLLVVLPLGFWLKFLKWNPQAVSPAELGLRFLGIALMVALPEELFFRGILDTRLRESYQGERWGDLTSIVISSFAFGLMHLNNRKDLDSQLTYVLLASIAGAIYALAFRRGGLLAAVLLHTLVDVVWQVVFR